MSQMLEKNPLRIQEIAKALCFADGVNPKDFMDYSDLRRGKERWEYYKVDATKQHYEEMVAMVVKQVQNNMKQGGTVAEIVRLTIEILES